MRRLTVPTSAACVALALAACGGSGAQVSGRPHASTRTQPVRSTTIVTPTTTRRAGTRPTATPPSPRAIRRAASLTASKPGFQARISASIRLPQLGGGALTATGSGHFDPDSQTGTLHVAVELPGLLGLVGALPTRVLLVGHDAYVRVPSLLASQLSTADTWLEVNTAKLDLTALDPATVLSQTARDATANVPDQRAHVTIDPRTGMVRTIRLTYSEPGGYHVRVNLRFTGFSAEPATQAPPSAEVGDLESALRGLGF